MTLCSLRWLNLRDCNLSDETNLSSLGFLSSLDRLFLEGNNFVTLPNINRLSHLELLGLANCTRLKELPDLPPNILDVDLKYCTSLKNILHQILKSLFPKIRLRYPKSKVNFLYNPYITILIIKKFILYIVTVLILKKGFCNKFYGFFL